MGRVKPKELSQVNRQWEGSISHGQDNLGIGPQVWNLSKGSGLSAKDLWA